MGVDVFGLKRRLNKKVVILIKGGLGNQMFQYATARGACKTKNVIIDLTFLQANNTSSDIFTSRGYELALFKNLRVKIANQLLLRVIKSQKLPYRICRRLIWNFKIVSQKETEYLSGLNDLHSDLYLDGYFQSEKYFKHIRNKLLYEFQFPTLDRENLVHLSNIQSSENSVSIHVRRGDYLQSYIANIHGVLPLEYYQNAIDAIKAKIRNPKYFIFSNDVRWCEENFNFLNGPYVIVDCNTSSDEAWKDMYLMTQCQHHIIANSSFSWWGAWLGTGANALNIAPAKWFNPNVVTFDVSDYIPSNWLIVDYD